MKKYQDGEWYVFEELTRKPLERLKVDATRALMQGLSALVTTHRWIGTQLQVSAIGSDATLDCDHGRIICRVRLQSFPATIAFIQNKILSDVEAAVREVSGTIDPTNKNVFIVHGHDLHARLELKDLLGKLGMNPIVLDEQDDKGMTVIEKFEYYASFCAFAFILITPDDPTATVQRTEELRWRARQNVIMELGWFIAHLGRERVAILYKDDTEIPSDIHGVLYARFDTSILEASERIRQRLKGVNLIA
jgi:predicted nucleotide-binding protein